MVGLGEKARMCSLHNFFDASPQSNELTVNSHLLSDYSPSDPTSTKHLTFLPCSPNLAL